MLLFAVARHLIYSRLNADGGRSDYYYYDAITWIVGALALAWLIWFLVRRYRQARALRRPPQRARYKLPKRIIRIKRDLSSRYLRPGFSRNIHAVGVGRLAGRNDYCIQVFISDANEEIWPGAGVAALPNSYRGVPLVPIEMPIVVVKLVLGAA